MPKLTETQVMRAYDTEPASAIGDHDVIITPSQPSSDSLRLLGTRFKRLLNANFTYQEPIHIEALGITVLVFRKTKQ